MNAAIKKLHELESALEDFEPKLDSHAWLLRESFELLARIRVMLESIANDEEKRTGGDR